MELNLLHIKSGCVLIQNSPGSVRFPRWTLSSEGRSSACLNHWTTWSVLYLYLPFLLYCQWTCLVHSDFLSSTLLLWQGNLRLWNEHWTFRTAFGIRSRLTLKCSSIFSYNIDKENMKQWCGVFTQWIKEVSLFGVHRVTNWPFL